MSSSAGKKPQKKRTFKVGPGHESVSSSSSAAATLSSPVASIKNVKAVLKKDVSMYDGVSEADLNAFLASVSLEEPPKKASSAAAVRARSKSPKKELSAAAVRSKSPKESKKVIANIPLEFDAELATIDRRPREVYYDILRDMNHIKISGHKQSLMRQFVGTLKAKAVFLQDKRSLKPEKWTLAEERAYTQTFNALDRFVEKINDTNYKRIILDMFLYLNDPHILSVLKNLVTTGDREDQLYAMYDYAWSSSIRPNAKGGRRTKRRRRCSSTRKI